jgi:dTDP-4-amino-4,6-dideoxygalactose transaminase
VTAIIGANMWGDACDAAALVALARARKLPIMFDSSHAFGCVTAGRRIGTLGDAEVLSFDAADIVNAAGGACVATDDEELAARLRNIRSSYGAGRSVAVVKTSNGRMSEAQAALGLLSLDDYETNRAHNRTLFDAYRRGLRAMPGIRIVEPRRVDTSNHQALVCAVADDISTLSRDALITRLGECQIEAVPVRPLDANERVGKHIGASWMRLPLGSHVSVCDVERVCAVIGEVVTRCCAAGDVA